ncbi:hypothetical protein [Kineococcus radiotolerans]|uniref:Uncharacterized protein n=1 Tax=Kineococcus radiotolerans (strain ATCC BAA-149 / DSM 14245 / SRS30216) TaxID=266940 RepID=A6W8P9_KINRD|nr:hypothetical protein [Kineococcus radiotolerans]ABS03188.1 hypothetical protein Krad_1702 [Kineococcus radiotolerans SRS30216 = ATCC BAA-149]
MTGYALLKNSRGGILEGTLVKIARSAGTAPPPDPVDPVDPTTPVDPTYPPDVAPNELSTGPVSSKLRWAPPTLVNPVTWNITSAATSSRTFANDQDVIINTPVPITWKNGVTIKGGRNIIWRGGDIRLNSPAYTGDAGSDAAKLNRGVYIVGNTGTAGLATPRHIFIEGLKISGVEVWEGVNVDMMNDTRATVTIQNYYCQRVNWRVPPGGGTHDGGDVLQVWRGPWRLRVDRLSAPECTYQSLFLQPVKFYPGSYVPLDLYQFRNMDFHGVDGSTYSPPSPKSTAQLINVTNPDVLGKDRRTCYNVYINPGPGRSYAQAVGGTWVGLQQGPPPAPFVDPSKVGIGYVSPGYENP